MRQTVLPSAYRDYATTEYERGQRARTRVAPPQPRRLAADVVRSDYDFPYPNNEDVLEREAFTNGDGRNIKELSIYSNSHAMPVHIDYKSYPVYFNSLYRQPYTEGYSFQAIVQRTDNNYGLFFTDEPRHVLELHPASFSIPSRDPTGAPLDLSLDEVLLTIEEWATAGYSSASNDAHHFTFKPVVVGDRVRLDGALPFRFNRPQANVGSLTLRFATPLGPLTLANDVLFGASPQPTNPLTLLYAGHGLTAGESVVIYGRGNPLGTFPVTIVDANTITVPYNGLNISPAALNIGIVRNLVVGHLELRGGPPRH
jgi:hypothetical protein